VRQSSTDGEGVERGQGLQHGCKMHKMENLESSPSLERRLNA